MKRQVRRSVFETNSSSTHSLTICTKAEHEAWCNGDLVWSDDYGFFKVDELPADVEEDSRIGRNGEASDEYEEFCREFRTPSGDEMVAFGYYG